MVDRPDWERGEPRARSRDLCVALIVGITHNGVGIGDIEIGTDQHHAERRGQAVEEDAAGHRFPVARSNTEIQNALTSLATSTSTLGHTLTIGEGLYRVMVEPLTKRST